MSFDLERRIAAPAAYSMPEGEVVALLRDTLYPGASEGAARLVLNYCKARRLDPMQKPVHLMKVSVRTDRKDSDGDWVYEDREVPLPGIGLYRVQAAETGQYAGCSEPEFGPMKTMSFKVVRWVDDPDRPNKKKKEWHEQTIEYPEWCRMTVKRLVGGIICEFPAVEYWLENYATAGRWTTAPNEMWRKRPRGQLAKCTEAQALRKGFPDAVGNEPTDVELEGKVINPADLPHTDAAPTTTTQRPAGPMSKSEAAKANAIDVDPTTGEVTQQAQTQATGAAPPPASQAPADDKPSPPASEGMLRLIRAKAKQAGVEESAIVAKHGIEKLEAATVKLGNEILAGIAAGTYKAA